MMLPKSPMPRQAIVDTLESYRTRDLPWKSGRTFGFVYDPGNEADAIGREAYAMYLTANGLDPTSFPSLMRLENEVVGMARAQAGGGEGHAGTFTSGGTESIILAAQAAREHARRTRPEITAPEMVLPATAHAAFHKAAHLLGVKAVVTPVDTTTFTADVAAMAAAITERTILLVASAPSYAHGVIDPVTEIGALAKERGLLCHVDACVGGFMLPFFRRLGADVPAYDLSVPGVTSLSLDLHKYAFTPKGASIVLFRDAELRAGAIFACASWTGYSVVNMALQSSKSGGPLAAAWAVMNALGDPGYMELARIMRDATLALRKGIAAVPSLRVLGEPAMSLLAFASDEVDVFHVADEMTGRGWYVQPQLPRAGGPASIHLTVGPTNARWVQAFCKDLREAVEAARPLGQSPLVEQVTLALEGATAADVPDEMLGQLMESAGIGGGTLPERLAGINQLLAVLPPALVERSLVAFMGQAFRGA